MIITFEQFKKHPDFKGIFVGGCVERGEGSSFRAKAHTHGEGEYVNWICVRSFKRVYMPDGISPSNLMLHEFAHVICKARHWHDDVWMMALNKLGGIIESQYKNTKNYKRYLKRKRGGE